MMCIEPNKVNIVIYRQVTIGAIKLLVKKLKFHVKGKQLSRANLTFFGGRELFTREELLKRGLTDISRSLFSISKRNTFTRLVLENSSGGPLSQEWFHTYKSLRHIWFFKNCHKIIGDFYNFMTQKYDKNMTKNLSFFDEFTNNFVTVLDNMVNFYG